jgi:hypothetical protein
MPDRYKPLPKALNYWTSTRFNAIYQGKMLLLISPILRIKESNDILVQFQLDVEGKKEKMESLFLKCVEFIKMHKNMHMTYTGKSGFHIYSNYLYYIKNGLLKPISEIREMILSKYNLDIIGTTNIDFVSSIRDMPTIRIGKRPDTKRLAFPILETNWKWFEARMNSKTFASIMSEDMLRTYISKFMIPYTNIIDISKSK